MFSRSAACTVPPNTVQRGAGLHFFFISRASLPQSGGFAEVYLVFLCSALTKEKEEEEGNPPSLGLMLG